MLDDTFFCVCGGGGGKRFSNFKNNFECDSAYSVKPFRDIPLAGNVKLDLKHMYEHLRTNFSKVVLEQICKTLTNIWIPLFKHLLRNIFMAAKLISKYLFLLLSIYSMTFCHYFKNYEYNGYSGRHNSFEVPPQSQRRPLASLRVVYVECRKRCQKCFPRKKKIFSTAFF